jgi:hypothetical protein
MSLSGRLALAEHPLWKKSELFTPLSAAGLKKVKAWGMG